MAVISARPMRRLDVQERGVITIDRGAVDEDRLLELTLEAGADDVVQRLRTLPGDLRA